MKYKIVRQDSLFRRVIGSVYNQCARTLFSLKIKDVDCDFRLFRRSFLSGIKISVTSGAFDAAFIKAIQKNQARIVEVGVYHYKRQYGISPFFRPVNVIKTLIDFVRIYFQ